MTRDPRKTLCDELAEGLVSEGGARIASLLRFTDPAATSSAPQVAPTPTETARALVQKYLEGEAAPIGIWKPRSEGEGVVFVRDEKALTNDWWPGRERLEPKSSLLPLRVVLVGESTAAGWFYAPELTPARVLEAELHAMRGPRSFEVIDLTMVNLQPAALLDLMGASLQLTPDVLVVFAGNNWPTRISSIEALSRADARAAALAFREDGVRGLVRLSDARSRETAERVVEILGRMSEASGVPIVVVIPEANLADWRRDRPVPWLPGDKTALWHRTHQEASESDAAGNGEALCAGARLLIELDSETCSTSFRLLARGLERLGDVEAARDAYLRALDLRSWDNVPSTPSATRLVRDALRTSCDYGAAVVDLPAIFREHLGPRVAGREIFLDYCHLTVDGMRIAMAAVTASVLRLTDPKTASEDWRAVLARTSHDDPPAALDGMAKIMTALYNAHYGSENGVVRHWMREAERAWPEARELVEAYAKTRASGPLSAAQQRFHGLLGRLQREAAMNAGLDPEILEILEEQWGGSMSVADEMERSAIDLSQPAFHWSVGDRYHEVGRRSSSLFYRARWPLSRFCLPSSGKRGVSLELCARLPKIASERQGEAELRVNGNVVARLSLSTGWERLRVSLVPGQLRAGLNEITVAWPPLPPEGDQALAEVGRRLEQGIDFDLHPRFGEIYALRARFER